MKKQKHLLSELWESYPALLTNKYVVSPATSITKHLAEMLSLGPFYYYVIHIADYSIHEVAETLLSIHGVRDYPQTLQQVINLIHPDDLDFVLAAEKATLEKMEEIGFQHQLNLKTSYCFRMRVADGSYHLFHHQAIHLAKDEHGRLITALNIHTDIQHITQVNNKIVLVNGIGERSDYCQMDLLNTSLNIPLLSKREMEVLALLAQGLSSQQIGDKLFISEGTVRVHRKHLLKKTQTSNSSNLIKKCIELSLL